MRNEPSETTNATLVDKNDNLSFTIDYQKEKKEFQEKLSSAGNTDEFLDSYFEKRNIVIRNQTIEMLNLLYSSGILTKEQSDKVSQISYQLYDMKTPLSKNGAFSTLVQDAVTMNNSFTNDYREKFSFRKAFILLRDALFTAITFGVYKTSSEMLSEVDEKANWTNQFVKQTNDITKLTDKVLEPGAAPVYDLNSTIQESKIPKKQSFITQMDLPKREVEEPSAPPSPSVDNKTSPKP